MCCYLLSILSALQVGEEYLDPGGLGRAGGPQRRAVAGGQGGLGRVRSSQVAAGRGTTVAGGGEGGHDGWVGG